MRPLIVVSGFLGSGKTTLLRRALAGSGGERTAVVVNELGEIGLDQHQYRHVAERAVVLDNGCLCCVTREDLVETLRELIDLEEAERAPRAERVVVETSGLADPGPIVSTVDRDPILGHRFEVAGVVVTCDAEHAASHAALPEWQAQVAAADVVAVTKADRAAPEAARELARRRNPAARVVDAREVDPLAAGRPAGGPARNGHGGPTATAAGDRPTAAGPPSLAHDPTPAPPPPPSPWTAPSTPRSSASGSAPCCTPTARACSASRRSSKPAPTPARSSSTPCSTPSTRRTTCPAPRRAGPPSWSSRATSTPGA